MIAPQGKDEANIRIRQGQLGFAHIGIIVSAVIFVTVAALIVWRVWAAQHHSNSPASATTSSVQRTTTGTNCVGNDRDICKFYAAWQASTDFKVTATEVDSGQTSTSTFESSDSGKRFHMLTSLNGRPYETINIDNTVYIKDASGTWWKQNVQASQLDQYRGNYLYNFTNPSETQSTQHVTYKALGQEACGTLTCLKYQVIDPTAADSTQYIWFDSKNYQLRRMFTQSTAGTSSDQVFSYGTVTINAPMPVKDLEPNQTFDPETGQVIDLQSSEGE